MEDELLRYFGIGDFALKTVRGGVDILLWLSANRS